MIGGIVEIAEADRYLSVYRGFMKVSDKVCELGRVPLDDITAVVLSSPQVTLSKNLMVELAERKSVIVTCGRNWHPLSITLPVTGHFESAGILHDQIEAGAPLQKRLWQTLVKAKIRHQAMALSWYVPQHPKIKELTVLERRVKSGDPENMEAQAARHYWPALMGANFRRDRTSQDVNAYLNYGYTVLRAATARAICAAGLHPALGVHHRSRKNAFALVDDLMEPYRPIVDIVAWTMQEEASEDDDEDDDEGDLTPERKRRLVAILQQDLDTDRGRSPLVNCLGRLAQSLTDSFSSKKDELKIGCLRAPGRLL